MDYKNTDTEKRLFPFSYSMIDYWFPLIHGTFGEDGQLQHQLEKTELPYIGTDKISSSICYDKILSREKAHKCGIRQPQYLIFHSDKLRSDKIVQETIIQQIGLPCFIKPAKTGSSLGISRVNEKMNILPALKLATIYDQNVIVEKAVSHCVEYEIAFIGNQNKKLSVPGTVDYKEQFYTTYAKYYEETTKLSSLKNDDSQFKKRINDQTRKIIEQFNVKDLGRVDFLYDKINDILYWNEINTIPGFTKKSMFPYLWAEEGMDLVDVIEFILEEVSN